MSLKPFSPLASDYMQVAEINFAVIKIKGTENHVRTASAALHHRNLSRVET